MKLSQMHIVYDFNRDSVGILHRPGDGSGMSVLPADQEFCHTLIQWTSEAQMKQGPMRRLWGRIVAGLGLGTKFTRTFTDSRQSRYTVTLTTHHAPKRAEGKTP